ncbi:MAG: spore maturation protein [Bacilli bacterium]|nr:spore maturation protein [Bacilli bacterium]
MNNISNYILPIIALVIIVYGLIHKVNVYESFLNGCKEGFNVIIDITPTIITMVFAIEIFLKSNFMFNIIKNIRLISPEVLSMMILRPVSGSATLGILSDVFSKYSPDSFNGLLGSLIQGSTETTIYVIALYYGSIGIKNIKNTLKIGLIVDLIGILLGFFLAYFFFL